MQCMVLMVSVKRNYQGVGRETAASGACWRSIVTFHWFDCGSRNLGSTTVCSTVIGVMNQAQVGVLVAEVIRMAERSEQTECRDKNRNDSCACGELSDQNDNQRDSRRQRRV